MKHERMLLLIIALATGGLVTIWFMGHRNDAVPVEPADDSTFRVGIVNVNHLAHPYVKAEELYRQAHDLQGEITKLQAAEDYEGIMTLDREIRDLQQRIMADFESDVQKVAEGLLSEMKLHFITTEVIAKPAGVELVDIMPSFMASEHFNQSAPHSADCSDCDSSACQH